MQKTLKKIKTFTGHTKSVRCCLFLNPNEIISCGRDDIINVWNINTGGAIARVDTGDGCISLAISPKKDMVIVSQEDGDIIVYEPTVVNYTLKRITYLPKKHEHWINSLCFTPDGKFLVSFSHDETINIYEVLLDKSFKHLRILIDHNSYVYCGSISPDGKFIASGCADSTIKMWDISTGRCIKTITDHADSVTQIAFSNSGSFLASVALDETLRITRNEDMFNFKNEKLYVTMFLGKSSVFIPHDICCDYFEFVNNIEFKKSLK